MTLALFLLFSASGHAGSYLDRLFAPDNLPNIGLFVAGVVGIIVAIFTLRVIRRQTIANERVAVATLRPKLNILAIAIIPGKETEKNGRLEVQDAMNWQIEYILANSGCSAAHVFESNLTVLPLGIGDTVESLLPVFPRYSEARDSFGNFTLESGQWRQAKIMLDSNTDTMKFRFLRSLHNAGRHTATTKMICFGFIQYKDELGVARRTGFGFEYAIASMSFSRMKDSNYEYAD